MSSARTDPCPICGRPPVAAFRPFCSPRCADVDLGNWMTGAYVIPVPLDEPDDEDAPPPCGGAGHGEAD